MTARALVATTPSTAESRRRALGLALAAAVLFGLLTAPIAAGGQVSRKATETVRSWSSPKAYTSAFARVDIRHDGESLQAVPVSGCKAHFVNDQIGVLVSTCGQRWRVRAKYVSLSGDRESFRIVYSARG